jgi:hypothetical protein
MDRLWQDSQARTVRGSPQGGLPGQREVEMIRTIGVAMLLAVSSLAAQPKTTDETWTGWFSDKQCARVTPGEAPRPNGTACVKNCLDEGSPAVFISEQAKAVYEVRDYASAKDNVGYYLRITGEVDEKAKTVSVKWVTRLSEVTAMCLVRRKVGNK